VAVIKAVWFQLRWSEFCGCRHRVRLGKAPGSCVTSCTSSLVAYEGWDVPPRVKLDFSRAQGTVSARCQFLTPPMSDSRTRAHTGSDVNNDWTHRKLGRRSPEVGGLAPPPKICRRVRICSDPYKFHIISFTTVVR